MCIYQQAETGPALAGGARSCPADPDGPETIITVITTITTITIITIIYWNRILQLREGEKVDQEMF